MVKIAIYVDTSGSMNERIQGEMSEDFSGETNSIFSKIRRGIGLKGKVKKQLVAKAMWENLVPTFKDRQTKVSTINSRGRSRVLAPLDFRSHEDLLKIQFPKANGGTYLWKFLVEEAEELGKDSVDWLFFLISDGMDMSSPPPFNGVQGFQPCIEAIKKIGIDVEFHIIGLGLPDSSVNVFRQVSGASGGSFVNIVEAGDDVEQAVEEVGGALEESLNPIARMASRQRRQQEYLESRQEGDLDITTDIAPPAPTYTGYTYGDLTIEDTNPEQLSQWQNDLLRIRGDEQIENIQAYENWVSMRSTPLFSDTPGIPIDSWALSAADVSLIASMKLTTSSRSFPKFEVQMFLSKTVELSFGGKTSPRRSWIRFPTLVQEWSSIQKNFHLLHRLNWMMRSGSEMSTTSMTTLLVNGKSIHIWGQVRRDIQWSSTLQSIPHMLRNFLKPLTKKGWLQSWNPNYAQFNARMQNWFSSLHGITSMTSGCLMIGHR